MKTTTSKAAHAAAIQSDIEANQSVGEVNQGKAKATKPAKKSEPKPVSKFKTNLQRWQGLKEQKGKLGWCIKQVLDASEVLKLTAKETALLRSFRKDDKALRASIKPNAKTGNYNAYQVFMFVSK